MGRNRERVDAVHNQAPEPYAATDARQQPHVGKNKCPDLVGERIQMKKKKKKFVLQCVICLEEHHTSSCPLLLGPIPYAQLCGLVSSSHGFFQIPYNTTAPPPKKVSATGHISIVEGEVSAELV